MKTITLLAALGSLLAASAGSASAQRDWRYDEGRRYDRADFSRRYDNYRRNDDRYYDYKRYFRVDSKELRNDLDRLRRIDRRIDDNIKELRAAERRHDWERIHHEQGQIDHLMAERRDIVAEFDRDIQQERRDHRDWDRDRDRDRRDWDRDRDRNWNR